MTSFQLPSWERHIFMRGFLHPHCVCRVFLLSGWRRLLAAQCCLRHQTTSQKLLLDFWMFVHVFSALCNTICFTVTPNVSWQVKTQEKNISTTLVEAIFVSFYKFRANASINQTMDQPAWCDWPSQHEVRLCFSPNYTVSAFCNPWNHHRHSITKKKKKKKKWMGGAVKQLIWSEWINSRHFRHSTTNRRITRLPWCRMTPSCYLQQIFQKMAYD